MLITLDFETKAIGARPNDYPPDPVGLSIKVDGGKSEYIAWGHTGDDKYKEFWAQDRVNALLRIPDTEFIFHNAPFDVSVIEEKWGFKWPWHATHDTMLMAFLYNPHGELSLKPLADQLLGLPPTERDAVHDWLVAHGIVKANSKNWGAFISYAPSNIVGPYAEGDTDRTYQVFNELRQRLQNKGIINA